MRVFRFASKYLDFPSAIAGAIIMGSIVGFINSDHGFWPAFIAAMKQALYTFLFGGVIIKFLYTISGKIKNKFTAVFIATLAVTLLTISLVFYCTA